MINPSSEPLNPPKSNEIPQKIKESQTIKKKKIPQAKIDPNRAGLC